MVFKMRPKVATHPEGWRVQLELVFWWLIAFVCVAALVTAASEDDVLCSDFKKLSDWTYVLHRKIPPYIFSKSKDFV
jgi:hypothetical protein